MATVNIWTKKGNFLYTGVMKNQHLILYWNLHQAPLKRVIILIVAILLAIQWCWQIFACANSMEIFQQKSSVISQKGKSQNWCFIKTKHVKLSKKQTFLTPWYASGGKKFVFFGEFGMFCFLETPVLKLAVLAYCRRNKWWLRFRQRGCQWWWFWWWLWGWLNCCLGSSI